MAAGGAAEGGCTVSVQNTIEVFSPPYLFRGPRPVISSATKFVEHGGTIEIKTPAASDIQRVVLARPAAVTHQTDSEQRVLPLSFQVTGPTRSRRSPGRAGGESHRAARPLHALHPQSAGRAVRQQMGFRSVSQANRQ